jgi:dolichol-phosphate mannosyltransferase
MYRGLRVIAVVPAYNEETKIGQVIARTPRPPVDSLLVVDDGSTDGTAQLSRAGGAEVLSLGRVMGVGAALRTGMLYGKEHGFDVAVFLAGNNKDEPKEIPRLLDALIDRRADLVVGSRFLKGGGYGGDMPAYRKLATRVHPTLLSFFTRKRLTESTNGFRALRLSCLDDPRLNLRQDWLDGYALEVYLLYKMIRCGYRHTEVPCTKIYPAKKLGITKMKPIIGWWDILRPVFLLGFGLRT